MNCREAQTQLFAERDSALDATQRAALDGHLAYCDACQRVRDDLTAAFTAWRVDAANVTVPDAEREWHAVRRRMRGGAKTGAERASRPRRNLFTWLALPMGAAAAAAVALLVSLRTDPAASPDLSATARVAHADAVEAPGNSASTMVFVDEKSGWLIVWASDKQG